MTNREGIDREGIDEASFLASPDIVYEWVDDQAVLVNLKTNQIYELNRTGARFWELLYAGYDRMKIQQLMLEEFDVAEADLAVEIEALLTSLRNEGIITPSN